MKKMNNKGFSLVELIIVIAIMAVLIGVLAPVYLKHVKDSKVSADLQNAEEIATSISVKAAEGGTNPAESKTWKKITFGTDCSIATAPKTKAVEKPEWYYQYDGNSVKVGLTYTGQATVIELYPTRPSGTNVYAEKSNKSGS